MALRVKQLPKQQYLVLRRSDVFDLELVQAESAAKALAYYINSKQSTERPISDGDSVTLYLMGEPTTFEFYDDPEEGEAADDDE